RRFNETFQQLFGRPPGTLRRSHAEEASAAAGGITVRLPYRAPYDWAAMIGFLGARAIPGVEQVSPRRYARTLSVDGALGVITVSPGAGDFLVAEIRFPKVQALPAVIARIRRVFDLTADRALLGDHLSRDPLLAPLVARRPGLRAPGGWDGFELAVRAILGQQISVAAARKLAGQLVVLHGKPVSKGQGSHPGLSHVFPKAERLARAELIGLGMPVARQLSLKALAEAAVADPSLFRPFRTVEEAVVRLRAI